jgi:hypothetical protein
MFLARLVQTDTVLGGDKRRGQIPSEYFIFRDTGFRDAVITPE